MQRLAPELNKEKILLAMGAVYLEEGQILEALFEVLEGDLQDIEVSEEAREFVIENINEAFLRLDMNYDPEFRADCLDLLGEMWDVKDRNSAIGTLENLLRQGHRGKFEGLKKNTHSLHKFKEIFKFDFDESEEITLSDEEFKQLAAWIERADGFVPQTGILAWDIARYVHLVRMCFFAGYLNNDEAWQRLLLAWPLIENKFSSWSEFAQSFLIGRTFWAGQEDPDLKETCERLLGHPASPWRFTPLR